jgi:hypothetical protein
MPMGALARLREELGEIRVPLRVEIVARRDASAEVRRRVERDGIAWTGTGTG